MNKINNKEFNHFQDLSNQWWDAEGKFKILHSITPLRIYYIKKNVINRHKIKDKKKRLFWQDLTTVITSPEFIVPITLKFKQPLLTRFGENANVNYKIMIDLLRDTEKWALGPHTDHPDKIFVILIYLPSDSFTSYLGTSLYTPKEQGFTCEGGPHYPHEQFNCCVTLPFLPNSAFGFCKNNVSFHGVESVKKVGDVRNLIQISVLKEDSSLR